MQSNNSSHYCDHTRQQDGWTVLAPPPQQDELPPPYTPEVQQPPPIVAATKTSSIELILRQGLTFEIPTNSNIIGATPVTRTKIYGIAVPFAVGYGEICQMMGLDLATARISYKWDNKRTNVAAHGVANATDWKHCLESGIALIYVQDLPVETAGGLASAAPNINNKKRKSAGSSLSSSEKKTFDYTKEFPCAEHKGDHCWVSTADRYHHRVDGEHTSLWAKEIAPGEHYVSRLLRTRSQTSPRPTCVPPHRHSPQSMLPSTRAPRQAPMWTTFPPPTSTATEYRNISAYSLENAGVGFEVHYPPVTDILQQIDDSGKFVDSIPFPTIIFADALAEECQITRVDHVLLFNTETYVHDFNMPPELAMIFVEQSILAMGRRERGRNEVMITHLCQRD
ncbi:hypothetical protein B0H14DRAFT_2613038 [Mycena olivaceomarginata]|nr:hypothetical protein B0H14DRAFT_2613038 [Mycena olivaceomarginata]